MTTTVPSRRWKVWWRRTPHRIRLGMIVALIALAALGSQHHTHTATSPTTPLSTSATPAAPEASQVGTDPDQPQEPAPTVAPHAASIDAARVVAQRFAANFATPDRSQGDWLARIGGDVSAQLREQYQLTDTRAATHATVIAVTGPHDPLLPGAAVFRASFSDGTQIQMYLEVEFDGWKVVNVVPVGDDDPAAAG